jgi:hypothetical protein
MYIVSSFYLPSEGETAKGSWAREGLEVGGKAERWVGARQRDLRSGRASERASAVGLDEVIARCFAACWIFLSLFRILQPIAVEDLKIHRPVGWFCKGGVERWRKMRGR